MATKYKSFREAFAASADPDIREGIKKALELEVARRLYKEHIKIERRKYKK